MKTLTTCVLAASAGLAIAHPIEAPDSPVETVHVCWPVDETGALTGTTVAMPIEAGVLDFRELRAAAGQAGDNRVDLVFVGDGYTTAEMGQYSTDVTNVRSSFFQYEPMRAYKSYFRITQVDVISAESGVDNDPTQGISKNTALDMSYWCSGIERLLCVSTSKAYAAAIDAGVPDIDQIIALANSSKDGGAGYPGSNLGTAAGQNSAAVQIAIHEIGHSLGDLADEYTYGGPETYAGGEPGTANSSIYTSAEQIAQERKWYQWMGASGDIRFDNPVGTYEGADYSVFGIYRPSSNSMMRSLSRKFNQPSSESLIRNIYLEVSPIDDAAAPGTYGDGETLWVTPMQPLGHALQIRWTVDGSPVPSLNDLSSVGLDSLGLAPGPHAVVATVSDQTDMVRDEALRASLMTDSRSWTANLSCINIADTNGDGILDIGDINLYIQNFLAGMISADINGDGFLDAGDIQEFVGAFLDPC